MSGKTCRFAPVAIDELNVSELYAARQPNPASWKNLARIDCYSGYILASRQRTDN